MIFWKKKTEEQEDYEIQELQSLGSQVATKPNKELDKYYDRIIHLESELSNTRAHNHDISNKYNNLTKELTRLRTEVETLKKPKTPKYIAPKKKTNQKSKISSLRKNLNKVQNEIKKAS